MLMRYKRALRGFFWSRINGDKSVGSEHPTGIFGVNGVYSESAESTF